MEGRRGGGQLPLQILIDQLTHEPLLLDRTVNLQLCSMWPFSTVIQVNFSSANSTTSENFGSFFVHGISYTPTDISLLKVISKNFSFEDFHNF